MTQALDMDHDSYLGWLRQRGKGIGGSDIGVLLGLNAYRDAVSVYDAKLELRPPIATNDHMRRGTTLEPHVADEYVRRTGRVLAMPTFLKHPTYPFLYGSPDRFLVGASESRYAGVLEIKCPTARGFDAVKREGIAADYYAQLQWYLGLEWELAKMRDPSAAPGYGAFAVFNADAWDLHHFDVAFDPGFFERAVAFAVAWWQDHIVPRHRPASRDPRTAPEVTAAPVGSEWITRTDEEWCRAVQEVNRARTDLKLVEHRAKLAEDRLKALLGDEGRVRGGGATVTYLEQSRTTLDTDALQAAHPTLDLSPFQKRSSYRVLKFKEEP